MSDETNDQLRDLAAHRGLKLILSRRRKAGAGDFGKFGLTDAAGKPLLGISEEGLTASAADVEAYLRTGAVSTWRQSAEVTPDRPRSATKSDTPEEAAEPLATRARKRVDRGPSGKASAERSPSQASPVDARTSAPPTDARYDGDGNRSVEPQAEARLQRRPAVKPAPEPAPKLLIRTAMAGDVVALARLIVQADGITAAPDDLAENLGAMLKTGGGIIMAAFEEPIGCCCWSVLQTAQHGALGRLTLLFVGEASRRRRIGTQLLATAEQALRERGCSHLEVMSDIEIRNAHGLFRTLGFEQTSYRFSRALAPS